MEEEVREGSRAYWPVKVIVLSGTPPLVLGGMVSLLPIHFPFPDLPSVDTGTRPHSIDKARDGFWVQQNWV